MNRKKIWVGSLVLLAALRLAWYIYSTWGLITIQADKQPLSLIINQIQSQGHIILRTNLNPSTPVTMHVVRVPVSEALETLSAVTESRWRLNYFLAPDKTSLQTGITAIASGNKPDDWKVLYYRMPPMFLPANGVISDPRHDLWPEKKPADNSLQASLDGAAKMANVAFAFPEKWNPQVSFNPGTGDIAKTIPKLAKAAGGKTEQVFLLTKFDRGQAPRGDRQADGPPPDEGGQSRNIDWMADRAQAEINRLSGDDRVAAQALLDKMQAFWKQMQTLSPDERRSKWQELMNDPQIQDKMQQQQNQRDARNTPQQKMQRAQNYVDRKQALLHPQ